MKFNKNLLIPLLLVILIFSGFYLYIKNNEVKKYESSCNLKNINISQIIKTDISLDSYVEQIEKNITLIEKDKDSYGCTKPEIVQFILSKHSGVDIIEVNPSQSGVSFHRKDNDTWSNYLFEHK